MKGQKINARVMDVVPLTDSITRLTLKPEVYVDYQPGQYLNILVKGEELSYSIANAPLGSHHYELHIRHSFENPYHQRLFECIREQGVLQLRLPLGECSLDRMDSSRPLIFIAGGTGFAPVHAMMEQLLARADSRPFELFWGARTQSDLYLEEKVKNWYSHVSRFDYLALLSDDNKGGLTAAVLTRHPKDLQDWQIVISGPFDMVYSVREVLVEQGVSQKHIFSDAFSYPK